MISEYILQAPAETDPLSSLMQYGVLGIFSVLLIIFGRSLIKREQDRADRLDEEVTRLNNLIQEKTIPALLSATQAIQASQAILQAMQYERDVQAAAASKASGRRGTS